MMRIIKYACFFWLIVCVFIISACSASHTKTTHADKQKEMTISAAASLQDALTKIKHTYEQKHPDVTLHINYGGSGSLQQQISKGAPVDLFFSAAQDKFDRLINEGKIDKQNSTDLLQNTLVLVVPRDNKKVNRFADLKQANIDKLALGTPASVPAGKYGKEALENMGIWQAISSHVVEAKDVRQVLTYVENGSVDAGLVYKTDAIISDDVKIVDTAADDTHDTIVYPVGLIKKANHSQAAKDFYTYLQTDEALKVFENNGFHIK